jgi:hypothetical protein
MRIAYIALHLDKKVMIGGVGGKIRAQLRAWEFAGHHARLFVLSPDNVQFENTNVYHYKSFANMPLLKFLLREFSRSVALKKLISAVAQYKPDMIYLRYGLFAYPLTDIFRVAPVTVELNANDVYEYRYRGLFYYLLNRFTRGLILKSAKGIIFPSNEIKQIPENQWLNVPVCVISNGIDTQKSVYYPAPKNEIPVLIFAGSPGYSWHGVDKIIELAHLCPDLRMEIVGFGAEDVGARIPPNIFLHGLIPFESMGAILAKADVAIGTLALHRKNMQEASALKVRESLMAGIPTIIAYEDTDLVGLDLPYILRLPNTEDNVHKNAERIRRFCYEMRGVRAEREKIAPRFDQQTKEKERLLFFEQIITARSV